LRFYPEFFAQPDPTYLNGMFQSEKFFAPVASLLRLHFSLRYPPLPAVEEMAARIRSGPSAAIHFRRGDYLRNAAFNQKIGVVGPAYYEQAVRLLRERSPEATLYIFSDDIETVAREFTPPGPHVFVRAVASWHPWDKLRLMSLCDHIAIANSTFSWSATPPNPPMSCPRAGYDCPARDDALFRAATFRPRLWLARHQPPACCCQLRRVSAGDRFRSRAPALPSAARGAALHPDWRQ
jgi:hypothetical protein